MEQLENKMNDIKEFLTEGYEDESIETFASVDNWEQKQDNAEQMGRNMWAKVLPCMLIVIIVGTILFGNKAKKIREQQRKEMEKQKKLQEKQKQIERKVVVKVNNKRGK